MDWPQDPELARLRTWAWYFPGCRSLDELERTWPLLDDKQRSWLARWADAEERVPDFFNHILGRLPEATSSKWRELRTESVPAARVMLRIALACALRERRGDEWLLDGEYWAMVLKPAELKPLRFLKRDPWVQRQRSR